MGETNKKYSDKYYDGSEELYNTVKPSLEKVIKTVHEDITKLKEYSVSRAILNTFFLDAAVGNHICDNHPEWFGITENEGHKIRRYFQTTGVNYPFRDYIVFLHRDFPEFMEKEEKWYVEDANKIRIKDGARSINPKTYQLED